MRARFGSLAGVDEQAWKRLVPDDDPFLQFAFLHALEKSGSTTPETGWAPFHLTLEQADGSLAGASPVYVKAHSHGEFVYDWRWAAAYEQAGGRYYPKLFVGPPFTPATGPRLLGPAAERLVPALREVLDQGDFSSIHVGCVDAGDRSRFEAAGFVSRALWQYHWHNHGYRDFDDFLDALKRKRRKTIRQERRRLARTGWTFQRVPGSAAEPEDWHFMHRLYHKTFLEKGNWPTLNQDFFARLEQDLGRFVHFVFAELDGRRVAGALFFRSAQALYGRYWGALEDHKFLHFETCYYQGIELALELGLSRFEPGAQGTHKIPRGFEPAEVYCSHYFRDPGLHRAVADSLAAESVYHREEGRRLAELSAFP
ncbi:MAG: GNAT family N-acetyltransferase [Xanthomonadales bacterium]|nr:GNAT family N-acetyltransferase [Xanthomonadales bacterium]